MPASTSSKTRVGMRSASAPTVLMASITRASSPPEATLASGAIGSPGLAENIISTASAPAGPISGSRRSATSKSRTFEAQAVQLAGDRCLHALSRGGTRLAQPAGCRVELVSPLRLLGLCGRDRRIEVLRGADLPLQALALLDRRLDRSSVLALDAVEHGESRLDRLESRRVGVQAFRVTPDQSRHVGDLLGQRLESRRLLGEPRVERR